MKEDANEIKGKKIEMKTSERKWRLTDKSEEGEKRHTDVCVCVCVCVRSGGNQAKSDLQI